MKDKPDTVSPDSPEATVNNIPCDQCGHPKSFHRQQKYYCMVDVMYNDPVNNNEPIKAPCSCTNFANAEEEAKKKKEKEEKDKEKEKEKEKPPKEHQQSPEGKDKNKNYKETVPSETTPALDPASSGGMINSNG